MLALRHCHQPQLKSAALLLRSYCCDRSVPSGALSFCPPGWAEASQWALQQRRCPWEKPSGSCLPAVMATEKYVVVICILLVGGSCRDNSIALKPLVPRQSWHSYNRDETWSRRGTANGWARWFRFGFRRVPTRCATVCPRARSPAPSRRLRHRPAEHEDFFGFSLPDSSSEYF